MLPGLSLKRWLALGALGTAAVAIGIVFALEISLGPRFHSIVGTISLRDSDPIIGGGERDTRFGEFLEYRRHVTEAGPDQLDLTTGDGGGDGAAADGDDGLSPFRSQAHQPVVDGLGQLEILA